MKIKKNVNEQEYFSQLLKSISADVKESISISMAIATQINSILKKKDLSQRDFANMLGKKESEISKWLSGNHNFTTVTLGKIQSVLGEPIITVPIYTKTEVKFIPIRSFSTLIKNGTLEDFSIDDNSIRNNSNLVYEMVINCKEGCYGTN